MLGTGPNQQPEGSKIPLLLGYFIVAQVWPAVSYRSTWCIDHTKAEKKSLSLQLSGMLTGLDQ